MGVKIMTAKRVDRNQREIVRRLREHGLSVLITSDLGHGAPDLVAGLSGMTFLFEVKDGAKIPSKQKLTPMEQKFSEEWRGHYEILKSLDDVDNFVISLRKRLQFVETYVS